ncbi:hypothetical protein [Alicycliphilus denitrificans]|uniref:hypothetical protein n=1 Tax=Alicycliphilus denitrificans TaxID=179636 RepID=UPI00384AE2A6
MPPVHGPISQSLSLTSLPLFPGERAGAQREHLMTRDSPLVRLELEGGLLDRLGNAL